MQKTFPRRIESLGEVFDFTECFFAREEIDRADRFAVNLVVEEVFTNMVKFNAGNPNEILVSLDREVDVVRIGLTDFDVDPFDITRVAPAAIERPLEERQPGGLGIHLIKKMVDTVHYEYENRQSTVTMTKKLG